jgi:glycosyltransferase involved in cell wall biosynthesis
MRNAEPMVSCILPTRNRRRFLPQALRCFERRTYANAELIVIDDSDRPVGPLCRDVPGVRYLRLTRPAPLGTKVNLAIAEAGGEFLQRLDDDDYYAPGFIATSAAYAPVQDRESTVVARCCFLLVMPGRPEVLHSGHGWSAGGSLFFHKSRWSRQPFRDVAQSEDSHFLQDQQPRIVRVCAAEEYIVVRHGGNTWNWGVAEGVRMRVEEYFARRMPYEKPLESLMPQTDATSYRRLLGWNQAK